MILAFCQSGAPTFLPNAEQWFLFCEACEYYLLPYCLRLVNKANLWCAENNSKFSLLLSRHAVALLILSTCLFQEIVLDWWGHHQHGQYRWQQSQHPLHQPERPCWWVMYSLYDGTRDSTPFWQSRSSCVSIKICVFQVSPLTLTPSSSTGSAQETAQSTAVNWTGLDWKCSRGWRESWPRPLLWPSWVGVLCCIVDVYNVDG